MASILILALRKYVLTTLDLKITILVALVILVHLLYNATILEVFLEELPRPARPLTAFYIYRNILTT